MLTQKTVERVAGIFDRRYGIQENRYEQVIGFDVEPLRDHYPDHYKGPVPEGQEDDYCIVVTHRNTAPREIPTFFCDVWVFTVQVKGERPTAKLGPLV